MYLFGWYVDFMWMNGLFIKVIDLVGNVYQYSYKMFLVMVFNIIVVVFLIVIGQNILSIGLVVVCQMMLLVFDFGQDDLFFILLVLINFMVVVLMGVIQFGVVFIYFIYYYEDSCFQMVLIGKMINGVCFFWISYDINGWVIEIKLVGGVECYQFVYVLDLIGYVKIIMVINLFGKVIIYIFDVNGNQILVEGRVFMYCLLMIKSWVYDVNGYLLVFNDFFGYVMIYDFDVKGQLLQMVENVGVIDVSQQCVMKYVWDVDNCKIKEIVVGDYEVSYVYGMGDCLVLVMIKNFLSKVLLS